MSCLEIRFRALETRDDDLDTKIDEAWSTAEFCYERLKKLEEMITENRQEILDLTQHLDQVIVLLIKMNDRVKKLEEGK